MMPLLTLIISIAFAPFAHATCADELLTPTILYRRVFDMPLAVHKIETPAGEGAPTTRIFGDEKQILFGLDYSRGGAGYLVIGGTVVRGKVISSEWSEVEYLSESRLARGPIDRLPPGIVFRLGGLTQEEIAASERKVNKNKLIKNFPILASNAREQIPNLLRGLWRVSGVKPELKPSGDANEALEALIRFGFEDFAGQPVAANCYQIGDEPTVTLLRHLLLP